jgi:hypothetical protein
LKDKNYCAVIVENRLTNKLFDTIQAHRQMLPEWWSFCHIDNPNIKTPADYNRLLTTKAFWEQFKKFDRLLIFQHDSMLLRGGINAFLKYDYIGAPLYHIDFPAMNGGLSLRNPKKMIDTINRVTYDGSCNEDIWFCNNMKGKLPTKEVAQLFSVETIFGLGSLGMHAIDKWHSEDKVNEILNQYK